MLADQRREGGHGAALGAAEDGLERRGLQVVGALVDVSRQGPVAVRHGPRRMADHDDVEAVEWHPVVAAAIDVKGKRHVAHALARPRRQGRGGRDEAGTDHIAVAVLEVVAGKLPFLLRRHPGPSLRGWIPSSR